MNERENGNCALPLNARQIRGIFADHVPGQLVIQLTDRCNGLCPQFGMRATETFRRSTLPVDEARRIIDAASERGFTVLSFTGGEPLLLLDDLCSLIKYAGRAGMRYIRTGTNGFFFSNPERSDFDTRIARIADALCEAPLRNLWISIDSADVAVHESMRGLPGVIKGIQKALPVFHERGLYPTANLGINRNIAGLWQRELSLHPSLNFRRASRGFYEYFSNAFSMFLDFVMDLGFTLVNTCYPMSVSSSGREELGAVYRAESADHVVSFTEQEKTLLFDALLSTIPTYRNRLRIFTPLSALHALARNYGGEPTVKYPCRGGIDFFFVDAKGDLYPCGYRGKENLGKLWNLNRSIHASNGKGLCTLCDWECFRDPSYLLGPFLSASRHPLRFASSIRDDKAFYSLWLDDLTYYKKCDFFDGRKPPRLPGTSFTSAD